jgi:plasmid stabilization system protein ParE
LITIQWTSKASTDVVRLHKFLASVNGAAAARIVKSLVAAPGTLIANPRIGERLDEFEPREVRRLLVGQYEMRYEIMESTVYILRVWHTREER